MIVALTMWGNKKRWHEVPKTTPAGRVSERPAEQSREWAAVHQQLEEEIGQRRRGEDQLKIHLDRLEQRIKQQSVELMQVKEQLGRFGNELAQGMARLTAAREQLQQRIAGWEQVGQRPSEQTAAPLTADQQLQQELDQVRQSEHSLKEKVALLTRANEQLQRQIAELNEREVELLEGIIDAEQPAEPVEVLNPQELKALSELAKRLTQ